MNKKDRELIQSLSDRALLTEVGDTPLGELYKASMGDQVKNLNEAVIRGSEQFTGDFFIEVRCKRSRALKNVYKYYFIPRKTCSTPDFDQTVYHARRGSPELELLWTIPEKKDCMFLLNSGKNLRSEDRELFNMVVKFGKGELHKITMKLNNEKEGQFRTVNILNVA